MTSQPKWMGRITVLTVLAAGVLGLVTAAFADDRAVVRIPLGRAEVVNPAWIVLGGGVLGVLLSPFWQESSE